MSHHTELQPHAMIEGEIVFGFYDFGGILCHNESDAQDFINERKLSISAQELLACHTILRNAGAEQKYAFTIIDKYQQRLTVYVSKETHDIIYGNPSYWTLERRNKTKYIRGYAQEIFSGIWFTEGPIEVTIRKGWPHRQHINYPRTWPCDALYTTCFIQGVRMALDDVTDRQVQKLFHVKRPYRRRQDIIRDMINNLTHAVFGGTLTMEDDEAALAMTCTVWTTRRFSQDIPPGQMSIQQEEPLSLAQNIAESPRLVRYRGKKLLWFEGIFHIAVVEGYKMIFSFRCSSFYDK